MTKVDFVKSIVDQNNVIIQYCLTNQDAFEQDEIAYLKKRQQLNATLVTSLMQSDVCLAIEQMDFNVDIDASNEETFLIIDHVVSNLLNLQLSGIMDFGIDANYALKDDAMVVAGIIKKLLNPELLNMIGRLSYTINPTMLKWFIRARNLTKNSSYVRLAKGVASKKDIFMLTLYISSIYLVRVSALYALYSLWCDSLTARFSDYSIQVNVFLFEVWPFFTIRVNGQIRKRVYTKSYIKLANTVISCLEG